MDEEFGWGGVREADTIQKGERDLKRCEECERVMGVLKKENEVLKSRCSEYEVAIKGIKEKVEKKWEKNESEMEGAVSKSKPDELRNDWKKENGG